MADCILTKRTGGNSVKANPNIYNYGGIVGLNNEIFNVDTNIESVYSIIKTKTQGNKNMSLTDLKLTINFDSNQVWYMPIKINTKGYKYLCVEAEASGKNGAYNTSTIGVVEELNDIYCPIMKIQYQFTHYEGSLIRYTFPRQVVKIDLKGLETITLAAHTCECNLNIYSIFLSNK